MFNTGVTQRNSSRILLNLIKSLKAPPPNVHAVNIHIFFLVHQLWLLLGSILVPLPYLFG